MPTPVKKLGNMRKHLTKAERAARQAAEDDLHGSKRATVKAPDWLSEEARKIFEITKTRMRGLNLLESVDADLLALYSDAIARYQTTIEDLQPDDTKGAQTAQSWSRLALCYAEKMGISATGRARLAKKKTEQEPVDDMDRLLNDVTDYVNGDDR